MKTYILELTEEELNFLYERCSRKAARLEEAHLKDIPCYRLSWQVMSKINKAQADKDAIMQMNTQSKKLSSSGMRLIPSWNTKQLTCYFCGETRSVKYEFELHDFESDSLKTVCACNKCALIHSKPEVK
jgi:hypothetical protein